MMRFYTTSAKPFHSDHYSRLVSLIDSCKSMQQIKQTHAQLITTALISHPVSANKLHKLAACASLFYAHKLFDQIPHPDLFIYNAMIRAHSLLPHSLWFSAHWPGIRAVFQIDIALCLLLLSVPVAMCLLWMPWLVCMGSEDLWRRARRYFNGLWIETCILGTPWFPPTLDPVTWVKLRNCLMECKSEMLCRGVL